VTNAQDFMTISSAYSDKRLLIIDDLPEMRNALRGQVAILGVEKVGLAGSRARRAEADEAVALRHHPV
jgi:hypothetical protein